MSDVNDPQAINSVDDEDFEQRLNVQLRATEKYLNSLPSTDGKGDEDFEQRLQDRAAELRECLESLPPEYGYYAAKRLRMIIRSCLTKKQWKKMLKTVREREALNHE